MLQRITRFWDSEHGGDYAEHLLLLALLTITRLLRPRTLPSE